MSIYSSVIGDLSPDAVLVSFIGATSLRVELTSKQYELIGRITLEFNELDLLVAMFFPYLVGLHETGPGEAVLDQANFFDRKLDLLNAVVISLLASYPDLQGEVDFIKKQVSEARGLSQDRNKIVHGNWISGPRYELSSRKGSKFVRTRCDEETLENLRKRIAALVVNLHTALLALIKALDEKRLSA